jgi:prophage antirepressor-like protein
MTESVPFDSHGDGVRVIVMNGEPWRVGTDAGAVLDIGNLRRVARRLHEADVGSADVRSGGQNRDRQWELIEPLCCGGQDRWQARMALAPGDS